MTTTTTTRRNRFQRGSGCFTCSCCGRMTRQTDENTTVCNQCYDIGGWENYLADGLADTPEKIETVQGHIARLTAEIIAKGGKI